MNFRPGTVRVVDALASAGLHLGRIQDGPYVDEVCCRLGPPHPGAEGLPAPLLDTDGAAPELDRAAARTATKLLESLLDADQLRDYRTDGVFWVNTPRGRVRLGREYDLRHVSPGGVERSLCVVPDTWEALPDSDVWATLVLWLNDDPDRFFRVAIENPHLPLDRRGPPRSDPPRRDGLADLLEAELNRMEDVHTTGARPLSAVATGLARIDTALAGLGPGHVVLVVGAAGSGKTAFALGAALRTAIRSRRRYDDGDPMRDHVVCCAPLADPLATTRALIAHDAMVRREDILHQGLTDEDWCRIVGTVALLSSVPLRLEVPGAEPACGWPPEPCDHPTPLVVVDDAATLHGDLACTLAQARELARARDTTLVLTASASGPRGGAPDLADVPAAVADRADVVVAITPRGRGRDVTTATVSVLKNRLGPLVECRAVLVNGWGRFLPVLPAR